MDTAVATLRTFNRSFTQRIGVLDDSFLDLGRPLAAARLLYEIGLGEVTTLDLRERLGLDAGYLSRLMRNLADDDLIDVSEDSNDRRRRVVRLTSLGQDAWQQLDDRSEQLARRLLEPLNYRQRAELEQALATVDRLIRFAALSFRVVDPESTGAVSAMTAYFGELDQRFPNGFDPGDAITADAASMREPAGAFVVAFDGGDPVACGGVVALDDDTGEIKRMWVRADWRGLGLGQRMLTHLESQVARLGHSRVVLDTNGVLLNAIAMYERAGYRAIERYNDNPYAERWFEKPLTPPAAGQ